MARFLVLFLLIEVFLVVSMANNVESLTTPTAPTPSSNVKQDAAEAPQYRIRRLGKHQHKSITRSSAAPCLSPYEPPRLAMDNMNNPESSSPLNQEDETTQVQDIKIKRENHNHSVDKSVAGGGVILGGLVTTFLVAIACYIRATRRKNAAEPISPTSTTSPATSKV